ncbi:hypothetical protein M0811_00678 [Anaeramoeba ignava]|uniref:Uncharacterized protein n=1 Tax=Anaeramoeba ignava TaxID=1746090 RepID=A0A9Q0LKA0_ANAIG|nr:hypothetical protein M0811_00678 [Anaeramoeba ignava]
MNNKIDNGKPIYKIVLIGDSSVGKSSILHQFCDNQFMEKRSPTTGIDFRFSEATLETNVAKLQIWDTAGQERYRSIAGFYYRNSHGVMIIYDITQKSSFQSIPQWIDTVSKDAPPDISKMIVGNKIDLEEYRQIESLEGNELADYMNADFEEVSAKTGENIKNIFHRMALDISKRLSTKKEEEEIEETNLVSIEKKVVKKKCC